VPRWEAIAGVVLLCGVGVGPVRLIATDVDEWRRACEGRAWIDASVERRTAARACASPVERDAVFSIRLIDDYFQIDPRPAPPEGR